jgi:16S rRNA (guanine(966)-N(2))-methyltransferase RsmD
MRVISGSAKGIKLASVPGKSTRPITDQVKEALFNIIGPSIIGKSMLDLFGGTGAVGIEALSRGAEYVLFLDTNYRAYKAIKQNLLLTDLDDYAQVFKKDAFSLLREEPNQNFDFIYVAPPQYQDLWRKAILLLDENPDWICQAGEVIIQIHPKEYDEDINYTNFRVFDQRSYGDTLLIFLERI